MPKQNNGQKSVLLTGSAGFVGMHTALALAERQDRVIGIDNINDYYDVNLKKARLKKVEEKGGIGFIEGDVCDEKLLHCMLEQANVSHVIHLAAQAGVRYSLDHPLSYIKSNVECFTNLLEAVRKFNKEKSVNVPITYASSSSVYGLNTKVPFSEEDVVDAQASLYGATKKSNENIAHVYNHIHKLKLTGLRFFTVYGPYGRPDMAYYMFTQALMNGKQVDIYKNKDGTELQRDFTYVSDIVKGILGAMDLEADLEVFNLGNQNPEKVSAMVNLLQEGTAKKLNMLEKEIFAGDVPTTYANTTHAKEMFGYEPKVSLREGLGKFLAWYKEYFKVDIPGLL